MINHYPASPDDALVEQWESDWHSSGPEFNNYALFIAAKASQWSSDQEFETCCSQLESHGWLAAEGHLRAARRRKMLSEKEKALSALSLIMSQQKGIYDGRPIDTIRAVLEALPND